jgi:hypothetical protein
MVQAAGAGMLDFSKADVLDRNWQKRVRWILDYVSSLHCIKIYEYKLQQRLALLPTLTNSFSVENCMKAIEAFRNKIINEMAPWVETGPKSLFEVAETMREAYVKKWGDPQDPEVQAELERLKAFWRGETDA